jgi:hypothetical protein
VGNAHNFVNIEVRAQRMTALADLVGLIRLHAVEGITVLIGVDSNRSFTEFDRCPEGADGNLSAVGHKNLGDHCHTPFIAGQNTG